MLGARSTSWPLRSFDNDYKVHSATMENGQRTLVYGVGECICICELLSSAQFTTRFFPHRSENCENLKDIDTQ